MLKPVRYPKYEGEGTKVLITEPEAKMLLAHYKGQEDHWVVRFVAMLLMAGIATWSSYEGHYVICAIILVGLGIIACAIKPMSKVDEEVNNEVEERDRRAGYPIDHKNDNN